MGKTIPVDQLAKEVMDGLEEYAELAADVMKKEIQETGKAVKQQISQTAPRKSGRYAKSWAVSIKIGVLHRLRRTCRATA